MTKLLLDESVPRRMKRSLKPTLLITILALCITGCVRIPDGIAPVQGFDADRYLGTWYEIARLDHPFERGLTDVSATYGLQDNGEISVLNRGWSSENGEWDAAEGRAVFVKDPTTGYLKVSFFGPFYGAYIVFALDDDYQHALVSGPNRDYLWLLARDPGLDEDVVERLIARAAEAGFDTDSLIRVTHQRAPL